MEDFLGRSPDALSLRDRRKLAGMWMAMELYSPKTLPLRRIEALGRTAEECIAELRRRGLDPRKFEMTPFPRS